MVHPRLFVGRLIAVAASFLMQRVRAYRSYGDSPGTRAIGEIKRGTNVYFAELPPGPTGRWIRGSRRAGEVYPRLSQADSVLSRKHGDLPKANGTY